MPLKIAFDAKRLFNNKSGLGNYSRTLVSDLACAFPDNEYFLYTPKLKIAPSFCSAKNIKTILPKGIYRFLRAVWRSFAVSRSVRKNKIDVFHGLSHELPWGIKKTRVKTVLTIHDLIFLRFPCFYSKFDVFMYKLKLSYACKNADVIIAISQQTKDDLITLMGVAEQKIQVIYQAIQNVFAQPLSVTSKQNILAQLSIHSRFILCVGNIEPRKNQLMLLKAMVLAKDVHIVIVGKGKKAYYQQLTSFVQQHKLTDRVKFVHGIPLEHLQALYQSCAFVVYPSVFEGFGLPIVEAIQSGKAVITSKGSCFSEAGGEGALYIDPYSEAELATKIELLWDDPQLCSQIAAKGAEHIKRFEGGDIAKSIERLYQALLQE
ncbi:MAG: glycosyltransferase family 4 protein [Bacteroidales bacterium]